jgi:3-hydroxyacyl-[acyl-carrier-protein] dehydratase
MLLKDSFFKIINKQRTANGISYTVAFNMNHFIYQAHFPANPITPGICIIQIIKELSEDILKRELFLKKVQIVKFLNVINPLKNKEVIFSISIASEENDKHKVEAFVFYKDLRFAKLTIQFINKLV